jgi:hypothetical protein
MAWCACELKAQKWNPTTGKCVACDGQLPRIGDERDRQAALAASAAEQSRLAAADAHRLYSEETHERRMAICRDHLERLEQLKFYELAESVRYMLELARLSRERPW